MATDTLNCQAFEGLQEAALLVIANAEKLRDWVNGNEEAEVLLGGVLTPAIRKLVATIDARESQAAKNVINQGVKDMTILKDMAEQQAAISQTRAEEAREAARKAQEMAEGVRGVIGTGKAPVVARQVQTIDIVSGQAVQTPLYYPFAEAIQVYCDGVLLQSGIHYNEVASSVSSGKSDYILPLFNVQKDAIWEFHVWSDDSNSGGV